MISHACSCSYSSFIVYYFKIEYDYSEERLANFNSVSNLLETFLPKT